MKEIQSLFPSQDGNEKQRNELLYQIDKLLTGLDQLKNPLKLTLGEMPVCHYNQEIGDFSEVPFNGLPLEETIEQLLHLSRGHRYVNANYVANAAPLPNTASIIGNLLMTLLNGNNLWDVESLTASKLEIQLTRMLSKIVGYNPEQSGGYTTWGGQGAVFNSLRIAISRQFPQANEVGIPPNLYCFCSELSHYSLYKSLQATGIGTNNLIKIRAGKDHGMDLEDLKLKMEKVIQDGGIPLYILATLGTTDSFGIDDLSTIKKVALDLEATYKLAPIYIHADTAMGGMYTFFNHYSFDGNPLDFETDLLELLKYYQGHFSNVHLADSMVFDFHKLGQTPYTSSFFLLKDAENLKYVDLDPDETPYVGKRGYGDYHTSYTLECSRMGSSIPIYASLLTLGVEGYQKLLANYLRVNLAFRKELVTTFPHVAITNDVSPITTFRFYPKDVLWEKEQNGLLSKKEVESINQFNAAYGELLGQERHDIYFGNTTRQCLVTTVDQEMVPVYTHKFFSISPYTTVDEVGRYMQFLQEHMEKFMGEMLVAN